MLLFFSAAIFIGFTAKALIHVMSPLNKDNGETLWHFTGLSAPTQQESCQSHSYGDYKYCQTTSMQKVRNSMADLDLFYQDQADFSF